MYDADTDDQGRGVTGVTRRTRSCALTPNIGQELLLPSAGPFVRARVRQTTHKLFSLGKKVHALIVCYATTAAWGCGSIDVDNP
jgi:hypothetical protein